MPAERLIINADDLGLCPPVDAGILDAWEIGAISDSTVFATAPSLSQVLQSAFEAGMPVGIHFNLTLGRPLSDPGEIPALVTSQGYFMKRQQWPTPLPVDQVRLELQRQTQRVLDLGWVPTHLDSHHHIHTYTEVFGVVMEIAQMMQAPVRAVDDEMRAALRRHNIPTPDHFSMAFYGQNATLATLKTLVADCPNGALEIMTHPGHLTPDLPSSYREEREQELAVLISEEWKDYLMEQEIEVVGFKDLESR